MRTDPPKTKRRSRRSSRVVHALTTELSLPLSRVTGPIGGPVPDEPATVKRLARDGIVAGRRVIGAQLMTVILRRNAAGHLVVLVRFEDAEEEWLTR